MENRDLSKATVQQPSKENAIPQALSNLDRAVMNVKDSFAKMEGMVVPVCRQEPKEETEKSGRGGTCEVSDLINSSADRLDNLRSDIEYICTVLET